ncbi:MAG: hypothetical protein N2320_05900, partial [Candidatus Bipolaricaulota bacterium]|nr:hypothetical protein [Candidatus Bipolaricaulota bacterium]
LLTVGMPPSSALGPGSASLFIRTRFGEHEIQGSWGGNGFSGLTFRSRVDFAVLGNPRVIVPLTATLHFDPSLLGLATATVQASAGFGWARLSSTVTYSGVAPDTSTLFLGAQGNLGDLAFTLGSTWRLIPMEFSTITVRLAGPAAVWGCPSAPFRLEVTLTFQKSGGFRDLQLAVRDLPLPCPGCDRMRFLFDTTILFTTGFKRVDPVLRVEGDWSVCLRPYVEAVRLSPGFGLEGLNVYGVEIRCELPGEFGLRAATSFSDSRNAAVTGDSRFFEVWQVYGPTVPCCGPRGRWQISTYFRRLAGSLFGWGMTEVQLLWSLNYHFTLRAVARFGAVDPGDPAKTWSLSVELAGLIGG